VSKSERWREDTCDGQSLISKLNDLDDKGYMPWKLLPFEAQDPQVAVEFNRKMFRILSFKQK